MYTARLRFMPGIFLVMVALGLMVGLALIRANPYTTSLSRDSGFFLYAGQQILNGKLPYLDFWDSKGPLIFYLNALGLWLGRDSRWGVWLVEFVFGSASAFFAYYGIAKKWGRGAALFANAAWLYGFVCVMQGGNLTEEYSLLFNFMLVASFLGADGKPGRKLFFLIGLTFALNFLLRANNTGVQISVLIAIILSAFLVRQYRHIWQTIVFSTLGLIVPFGVVVFYFTQKGILARAFEAAILYNFFYAGANLTPQINLWSGMEYISWPAYIALAGYAAVLIRTWRTRRENPLQAVTIFLLIGLPLEIAFSSMSGKNYIHYFVSWLPVIAVLNASAYAAFSPSIFSTRLIQDLDHPTRAYRIILPILLLAYVFSGAFAQYKDIAARIIFGTGKETEQLDPVSCFVRENTQKNEKFLVWGAFPTFYFLAQRDAPTAYLYYPAYADSPFTEKMGLAFFQDITTNMPKIIVDAAYNTSPDYVLSLDPAVRAAQLKSNAGMIYTPPYQEAVFQFIKENYQQVDSINGFDIYFCVSPECP